MQRLTALDFVRFAIDCGGRLRNKDAQAIHTYFHAMLQRGRVISVTDGTRLLGFCTFFLLRVPSHAERLHFRKPWTTPEDYANGTIVFIDLVACPEWSRDMRDQIEAMIVLHHSQVRRAIWFRLGTQGRPDRERRSARKEVYHGATV